MMNKELLALLIAIGIFIVSVLIFAAIYHHYNKDDPDPANRSFTNALYTSVTIQTSIGLSDPPNAKVKSLQIWVIVQSIITYLIGLGVVFILVRILFKDDDTVELRIEKKLGEMKDLIQQLHSEKPKKKN
jgi:hypothetical protein